MRHATRRAGRALTLALAAALAGLGGGTALRADDAKDKGEAKKVEGDLKAMQGAWVRDGEDGPDARFEFDGDTLKVSIDGMDYVSKIMLNPKAAPHPSADLTIKEGPGDSAGKSSKAIYKLDGKKLKFRVSLPGIDARPTEFKADDPDSFLFELKKEEK